MKALVARTCGCDLASDALRNKVLARIRQVQVEISQGGTYVEVTETQIVAD